jgi:putative transposase
MYIQKPTTDPDPSFGNKRIVATDPGNRSFHTWYSPTSGQFGELLSGADDTIEEKCFAIDALHSRVERRKAGPAPEACGRTKRQRYRTTRRLKRRLARLRRQLSGWVEHAHYDSANFLLRNFDIIIEPRLGVSEFVQKSTRVFSSASARKMLTWSHYKFRERLKSASARYEGRHVIESTEPGTSKTCTNCGFWKKDLGANKTYKCNRCAVSVDRDVAGARNNFFSEYGRAVGVGWDGKSG